MQDIAKRWVDDVCREQASSSKRYLLLGPIIAGETPETLWLPVIAGPRYLTKITFIGMDQFQAWERYFTLQDALMEYRPSRYQFFVHCFITWQEQVEFACQLWPGSHFIADGLARVLAQQQETAG
jgi:hypothetical protein